MFTIFVKNETIAFLKQRLLSKSKKNQTIENLIKMNEINYTIKETNIKTEINIEIKTKLKISIEIPKILTKENSKQRFT